MPLFQKYPPSFKNFLAFSSFGFSTNLSTFLALIAPTFYIPALRLYVAVSRVRGLGLTPKVTSEPEFREFYRGLKRLSKGRAVAYDMVGGKHNHHRIGVFIEKFHCRERDGRAVFLPAGSATILAADAFFPLREVQSYYLGLRGISDNWEM